jgi:hypothetical protein
MRTDPPRVGVSWRNLSRQLGYWIAETAFPRLLLKARSEPAESPLDLREFQGPEQFAPCAMRAFVLLCGFVRKSVSRIGQMDDSCALDPLSSMAGESVPKTGAGSSRAFVIVVIDILFTHVHPACWKSGDSVCMWCRRCIQM